VQRHGYVNVTAVLRRSFSKHATPMFEQHPMLLDYAKQHMKAVRGAMRHDARQLVVLHYRTSHGANGEQQNFAALAMSVIHHCAQAQFHVAVIYADDRRQAQDLVHPSVIAHLRPFQDAGVRRIALGQDLGKLAHLALLLCLHAQRTQLRLAGVVGNTSGTLDLAALIGLPVLNLHTFAGAVATAVDYQAYRLMLQALWLRARATVELNGQGIGMVSE